MEEYFLEYRLNYHLEENRLYAVDASYGLKASTLDDALNKAVRHLHIPETSAILPEDISYVRVRTPDGRRVPVHEFDEQKVMAVAMKGSLDSRIVTVKPTVTLELLSCASHGSEPVFSEKHLRRKYF